LANKKREPKTNPPSIPVDEKPAFLRTEREPSHLVNESSSYKNDDEEARGQILIDANGWPSDKRLWSQWMAEALNLGDPGKHLWLIERRSFDAYMAWHGSGVPFETCVDVITDVLAKKRDGPPGHMGYFTREIAQTHADRLAGLKIPEPRNPNERFDNRGRRPSGYEGTVSAFAAASEILARKSREGLD